MKALTNELILVFNHSSRSKVKPIRFWTNFNYLTQSWIANHPKSEFDVFYKDFRKINIVKYKYLPYKDKIDLYFFAETLPTGPFLIETLSSGKMSLLCSEITLFKQSKVEFRSSRKLIGTLCRSK